MKALAILIGLEVLVAAACFWATRGDRRQAALGMLAVTAPLEVYRTTLAGLNVSVFRLSLLAAVLVIAPDVYRRRTLRALEGRVRSRLAAVYMVLLVLIGVSVAFKPVNTGYGLRLVAIVAIGFACLVVIAELADGLSLERLLEWVALGSVLPVLAASWQGIAPRVGGDPSLPLLSQLPLTSELNKSRDSLASLGELGQRLQGTFADPNHFGAYLAITLTLSIMLLVLAVVRRNWSSTVSYAALAVADATVLVLTYSRTAWLAATVGVVIFATGAVIALRRRVSGRRLVLGAFVLAAVGALLAVPLAPSIGDRLDLSSKGNLVSDQSHEATIRAALSAFTAHPILGIGVGGLGVLLHEGPLTSGAHSSYATEAAELGVAGVALLLVSGWLTMSSVARRLRGPPGVERLVPIAMLAAYFGFLVANGLYDLWFDDFHFMVLGVVAFASPVAALTQQATTTAAG